MNWRILLNFLNTNEGLWTSIGILIVLIGWITGFFRAVWKKIKPFILKIADNKIPKETLRFVPQQRDSIWSNGTINGKLAMHLTGHFFITNITEEQIIVTGSYLVKPRVNAEMTFVRHPERDIYGVYPVFPKQTSKLIVNFWIEPPIVKKGENFKSNIVITDQFGNEHMVKNVKFISR